MQRYHDSFWLGATLCGLWLLTPGASQVRASVMILTTDMAMSGDGTQQINLLAQVQGLLKEFGRLLELTLPVPGRAQMEVKARQFAPVGEHGVEVLDQPLVPSHGLP